MSEFKFSYPLKVRISDINYGNHVSYAYYLLYFQDARISYLNNLGFSELDIGGKGIIALEANCKYKSELFLGDEVLVKCKVGELKTKGFTMDYLIEKQGKDAAEGKIVFLCYDYEQKKISQLPQIFVDKVKAFEGGI